MNFEFDLTAMTSAFEGLEAHSNVSFVGVIIFTVGA
jgi:hypothetical protein